MRVFEIAVFSGETMLPWGKLPSVLHRPAMLRKRSGVAPEVFVTYTIAE
jgi:hypothetical protein